MQDAQSSEVSLPATHHGDWQGVNRLWLDDPEHPLESPGTLSIDARAVRYSWSHEGRSHTGVIGLKGQPAALEASWTDSFHAKDGFTFHGLLEGGVLSLYGVFDAGDTAWGWRIELDCARPGVCVLRMQVVAPGASPAQAVELSTARE